MERRSPADYFAFGMCFRYLQDAQEGFLIHDTGYHKGYILHNIKNYERQLNRLGLRVTLGASGDLWELHEELSEAEQGAVLSDDQAKRLSSIMKGIRKTIRSELGSLDIYVVTPKRIDSNRLLKSVQSLFSGNVFFKLPDIARFDFREAGKCLAFERATAAAFHLLRGTESVLRTFYCHHVKRGRLPTPLLWRPMLKHLRDRRRFRNSEHYSALFNHLDNICISFRNPTQHPDKVYDIEEAQDLWGLCVEVVNKMAKDLPETEEIPF
jgi:hypothetical protein